MGTLVVIPLISLGIWVAGRLGVGDLPPTLIAAVRLTVLFAGLPALATCGGVGRLATEACAERGRGRALWVAGRAMAAGGAGLIILAAIPTGTIPDSRLGWGLLAGGGVAIGALGGVLIGLVCSGDMPTLAELGMWPRPDRS